MEYSNIKINRIVIWGLRKKWHTHRFIHKAFYENAKKLGYEVIWVEDEKKNAKFIKPGDLIISADPVGKMVPEKFKFEDYNIPVRDDIFYCLHNMKTIFTDKLTKRRFLSLCIYNNSCEIIPNIEKLGTVTFFDKKNRTLYQPWGTDLLDYEFKKPIFRKNNFVFWIGSIWNDVNNHGNVEEINNLKNVLKENNLKFIHLRFIPNWLNMTFVRLSRIAPAIGGRKQVEIDYLPCRMFKNISYGQLGITNIKKFKDILGDYYIEGDNIKEIIGKALSLSKEDYLYFTKKQQEIIKNYTYKNAIENIINCLDLINY